VADLASGDQLRKGTDGLLDGDLGVHPVLVVEVDVVGAQSPQRALDSGADVRRAAVELPRSATGVRHDAELDRQHDLVASLLDRSAHQRLVVERPIDLGGIEMVDAEVQRPVDGADRLGLAAGSDVVVAGHRHGAEAEA
jgi:hypothetical protein